MPCHGHSARFGIAACKTGIYVAMFGKNLAKIIGRIVIRRIGMSQIKLIQVKTANQKIIVCGVVYHLMERHVYINHFCNIVFPGVELHKLKSFIKFIEFIIGYSVDSPFNGRNFRLLTQYSHIVDILQGKTDNEGAAVRYIPDESARLKLSQSLTDRSTADIVFTAYPALCQFFIVF